MTDHTSRIPAGNRVLVRVDSAEEQYAWLLATFGTPDRWTVVSQSYKVDDDGTELEIAIIAPEDEEQVEVTFAPATPEDDPFGGTGEPEDRTGLMDDLMEKAATFAAENPPHHPGSIARFPVPSASYAHAVTILLPVLALDQGHRGLYAPPRMVVIDWQTRDVIGVGEVPGFEPEDWPPPRLGDWPPTSLADIPQQQLQGMIERFSACWSRVLDAWFAKDVEVSPGLRDDVREALRYRARLDLPGMIEQYDRVNPVFAKWLQQVGDGSES